MTDDDHKDDGVVVIEDTGESLNDFVYDEQEEEKKPDVEEGEEHGVVPADSSSEVNEEVQKELDALKERYLRTLAELDNFKKRSKRDKEDHVRAALSAFFCEFLPILDNLHRAITTEATDYASFKEGIDLISRQIDTLLTKFGVEEIELSEGDVFDPLFQEAVTTESRSDVETQSVGEVFQKGYRLNEKLLRPAMVKVFMPAPKEEGGQDESPGD